MQQQSLSSKWRLVWPRLLGSTRTAFTQEEVRRRLRLRQLTCERTAAVHDAAARTAVWSSLLPDNIARDLGAAGRRLPSIVFWHIQGVPLEDIGKRVSPLGGAWDADRALDAASALIAYVLNEPGFINRLVA